MHAQSLFKQCRFYALAFCCSLFLLLLANGAFALPKSPFLGLNDDSQSKSGPLFSSKQPLSASAPLLGSMPFQASLLNVELNGLTTVTPLHVVPCHGEGMLCLVGLYSGITYVLFITPIALLSAGIGQGTHNHSLRNFGNIALYPWLWVPPALDLIGSSELYDGEWLLPGAAVTTIGLLIATTGQAIGKHQLRNSGNITYLVGIAASLVGLLLSH